MANRPLGGSPGRGLWGRGGSACEGMAGRAAPSPYYRSSRPLPRGGLGGVSFLGASGETDGTLPSTRARNLAGYPS
eukprot:9450305-Pyramimonas_sp.AAC.1